MQAATIELGRRVHYSGDMANRCGDGVIASEPGGNIEVILFDGRRMVVGARSFEPSLGQRFHLLDRVHGPALIELAKRQHAQAEAARVVKQEADKVDHAAAVARHIAQNPHLQPAANRHAGAVQAAKNVRLELKRAGIKPRSVRSDHNSMTIYLAAGTSDEQRRQAEAIANRHKAGHFDGMTDCYEYERNAWGDAFGSAKFVFVERDRGEA